MSLNRLNKQKVTNNLIIGLARGKDIRESV